MNKDRIIAISLFVVGFLYYAVLGFRVWTWYGVGQDSGDWLSLANRWLVPQPYGSPLYIVLLRAIGSIFHYPNQITAINLLLCALPSAVTLAFVYLSAKKLSDNTRNSIIAASVFLGTALILSQTIIIEEYALATMFVTLAFYSYINGWRKRSALFIGLGVAVHIIVLPIAMLWLLVEAKNWRLWVKPFGVFILVGVLPYTLILVLMAIPTLPKFMSAHLSWQGLNAYLGSTGTIGTITIIDLPKRLYDFMVIILSTFGLALIPLAYSFKKPFNNILKVAVVTIAFCIWIYITDSDYTTWTFMAFAVSIVCILVALGLNRLPKIYWQVVFTGAIVLIAVNSFIYNGRVLAHTNNRAVQYYNELSALPPKSAVIIPDGGAEGFGLIYFNSLGHDIAPILLAPPTDGSRIIYNDYMVWANDRYGFIGKNENEIVRNAINNGWNVYYAYTQDKKTPKQFYITYDDTKLIWKVNGIATAWPN